MMKKIKLLFIINQFFKGGAEIALLNLLYALNPEEYDIDLLVFDQIDMPEAITLFGDLPSWIHTINIAYGEGWAAYVKKAWFHIYRRLTHRQLFRRKAISYLKGRKYDVTFSFGEWFSSRLAAEYVQAKRKYVWIHADIDKADFLHSDILRYQQYFDRFIFASIPSMQSAERRYPVLCGRGMVIHNLVDEKRIRRLSEEALPEWFPTDGLPILLTVANIRSEKNHLRQVRIMENLFQKGKRFYWINVGALVDRGLSTRIRSVVHRAGLDEYFLLPGAVENPYVLMKHANAVCVLSDHESWSMVITEAKVLGVPVIATHTSGALEQIEDDRTGILCSFDEENIAETIFTFLSHPEIGERIRAMLQGFSLNKGSLQQLESLMKQDGISI